MRAADGETVPTQYMAMESLSPKSIFRAIVFFIYNFNDSCVFRINYKDVKL